MVYVHQTANMSQKEYDACVCSATVTSNGHPRRLVAENGATFLLLDAPDMERAASELEAIIRQGRLRLAPPAMPDQ